jgi:hypothetical protein
MLFSFNIVSSTMLLFCANPGWMTESDIRYPGGSMTRRDWSGACDGPRGLAPSFSCKWCRRTVLSARPSLSGVSTSRLLTCKNRCFNGGACKLTLLCWLGFPPILASLRLPARFSTYPLFISAAISAAYAWLQLF